MSMIALVGTLVVGGTSAFFSDTESSTGNTFTAGDIDLQIGNESYYSALNPDFDGTDSTSLLPANDQNSFEVGDLNDGQAFFTFGDLKPGDLSEDTITITVGSNDAYACAYLEVTANDDGTCNEPELDDDLSCVEDNDNLFDGELAQQLNFVFWADDGDNVFEDGEQILTSGSADEVIDGQAYTLADSQGNVFAGGDNVPMIGDEEYHIGKAWCFGELTASDNTALEQLDAGGPDERGSGVTCEGAEGTDNASQTDVVEGIVAFYAVQERNNPDFTCSVDLFDFEDDQDDRPLVGAALGAYVAPTAPDCDFTVEDDESIQAAVDGAATDDTICIAPTYTGVGDTFPVTLDATNLTVAGLGAAGDTEIPGGFFVDASGVTVTGLEFTDYSFIQSSGNAAIYIHNEPGQGSGVDLTGTTISNNIFTAPGGAKAADANAIMTETGSASAIASGITVTNNTFADWRRGIFFNPSNYTVTFNTFTGNDVGIANDGPENSSITNNNFDGNVLEAVGVAPSAIGATSNDGALTVNTNNFGPAGAGNNVNWYGPSVFGGADVDATGNWWDGEVEADRTNDIAEVDTSSPEAVPFTLN